MELRKAIRADVIATAGPGIGHLIGCKVDQNQTGQDYRWEMAGADCR